MRCLLDTHALIWWWDEDAKLPASARQIISDPQIQIFVSAVSGWEIATKVRLGKLPKMAERINEFSQAVREDGFIHLDIRHDHTVKAGLMPGEHRDPFDRVLAAQALLEGLTLITRDREMAMFGCKVIW